MNLDFSRRDPLVVTLTERAAVLITENRGLKAEVDRLQLEVGKWRCKSRLLQRELDDLILREAARESTS